MMDGRLSSCVMYSGDDAGHLSYDPEPLSWSWSANLRHTLILNERAGSIAYRDGTRRISCGPFEFTDPADAVAVFEDFANLKARPSASVIYRMLDAFRNVRTLLSPFTVIPLMPLTYLMHSCWHRVGSIGCDY